jgi:hypothetical protein
MLVVLGPQRGRKRQPAVPNRPRPRRIERPPRARSSVGERSLHTREVAGSSPAVPIVAKAPLMAGFFVSSTEGRSDRDSPNRSVSPTSSPITLFGLASLERPKSLGRRGSGGSEHEAQTPGPQGGHVDASRGAGHASNWRTKCPARGLDNRRLSSGERHGPGPAVCPRQTCPPWCLAPARPAHVALGTAGRLCVLLGEAKTRSRGLARGALHPRDNPSIGLATP